MLKYIGNLKKNKKGSLADVIFGGAYFLKISVTILIMVFVWVSFQALMAQATVGTSSETVINSTMTTLRNAYYGMDYLFPLIVGGLLLVSTLFAYKTGANFIYGVLSFIIWIIAVILSVLFVNVYITVSAEFPDIYAAFKVMDLIMSNLHFVTLGWLAIITVVMFRKNNAEDEASAGNIQRRFYG
jgi:phosphoglycerol transferase MdoB-like AlkP superfamily enzyme